MKQPLPNIGGAINSVANYEPKIITYLALNEGDRPMTSVEVTNAINQRTGLRVSNNSINGYLHTFQKNNFAKGERQDRLRKGVSVFTAAGQEVALPVIGSFLEWSNTHGESLVKILSLNNSSSDVQSPINTLKLYHKLLQKDGSVTASAGGEHADTSETLDSQLDKELQRRMRSLATNGFIRVTHERERFKIIDPTYKGLNFEGLTSSTKAVYQALQTAKEVGKDKRWSRDEIIDLAIDRGYITEDQLADFKFKLIYAVSDKTPKRFPDAVEKQHLVGNTYTIAVAYRNVIKDLVSRAEMISIEDPALHQQYAKTAIESFQDGAVAASIWQRGKQAVTPRKPRW